MVFLCAQREAQCACLADSFPKGVVPRRQKTTATAQGSTIRQLGLHLPARTTLPHFYTLRGRKRGAIRSCSVEQGKNAHHKEPYYLALFFGEVPFKAGMTLHVSRVKVGQTSQVKVNFVLRTVVVVRS